MKTVPRSEMVAWLAVVGLGLAGCAKAGPARSAEFVPAQMLSKPDHLPFHKAWRRPGVDWSRYTEIYFAPVNTDFLLDMDWSKETDQSLKMKEGAAAIARYTEQAFKKAFREDPNDRFLVVEHRELLGPNALVGEIALVEIVPSHVVLNTLGYAPFGVGTAVKLVKSMTGSRSTVAFEARVRDHATGQVLAMFADREAEKIAPITLNDITWYGHAEDIIDEWAEQFVQIANRPGETIPDSRPFTLKPW